MITHAGFVAACANAINSDIKIVESDVVLNYLPLAHVMERCTYINTIKAGGAVGFFNGDVKKIKDDLITLKPTIFVSVPRLYNKFYAKIMEKLNEKGGLLGKLI